MHHYISLDQHCTKLCSYIYGFVFFIYTSVKVKDELKLKPEGSTSTLAPAFWAQQLDFS
jgi:hypothetical protein